MSDSFDKAFIAGANTGAATSLELLKEKIKKNDEQRQSGAIFDVIHQKLVQDAISKGQTPEQAEELSKKLDKMSKLGFAPTEALAIGKMVAPDVFMSDEAKAIKEAGMNQQSNNEQDRLEQNAKAALMSVRGDSSIVRVETQRDASATAYRTIQEIKDENRTPSQVEYFDILGQLWKARTGSSPTDQAIRDLDAKTFKGNLAKATQYFTGQPAGVTTPEILDNIQQFARKTGEMADEMHAGYMQPHLIKPKNLSQDRWDNILKANRGLSFKEAAKIGDEPVVKTGVVKVELTPALAAAELAKRKKK